MDTATFFSGLLGGCDGHHVGFTAACAASDEAVVAEEPVPSVDCQFDPGRRPVLQNPWMRRRVRSSKWSNRVPAM